MSDPGHARITFLGHSTVLVAIGGALGVTWFLNRSAAGRAFRACAQDTQLAQICGVNPDQTIQRAFAFGGALDYTTAAGYLGSELYSFMVPLLLLVAGTPLGIKGTTNFMKLHVIKGV